MGGTQTIKTDVVIVGAGPAGLGLAIELGLRGVDCVVVERNERVGYAPRAKTTNVRTREHFRRWGIAGALRAASPLGVSYPSNVVFVTRLAGHELARFENAFYCAPGRNPLYSEHAQWIPQYSVEEVMRRRAESLPTVRILFRHELKGFEQDGQGVRAQAADLASGQPLSLHGAYLVGADGARSTVREMLGIAMQGTYGLSANTNIIFRAPGLAQAHRHGPAIMYWQVNGESPSLVGPMDSGDKWFFMGTGVARGQQFDPAGVAQQIAAATGIAMPYEILSSDEWTASKLIGERYTDRRVFLAGDACHLHPPFGGYGMNMGVADSVDLGWKLAATLQGWGGPGLLASYEAERRPVHERVMDEAVANHALLGNQLWRDGLEADDEAGRALRAQVGALIQANKLREFVTLGVVLGYRYDGSPIVVGDGTAPPADDYLNYVPSARPGSLAPHAWLHDGSSLYDHFGPGFTLLATAGADEGDIERALSEARQAGVPLTVARPREAVLGDLYRARLALVRPDQHVAWRGDTWTPGVLGTATGWRTAAARA
ncbi:2,4-dichlorophenol 6-monooxygenase [Pigmentiphaga humi]|uniref:2,4-dichlorophenol 6-monooxygenase n=1 Tax=Pigmentiphaga humi TaxID=2478468 RepID=A0A3P4B525_9BURK|nr:FAD-dependent monooxygenase [Pigmentiphaga humi]VCU71021.1 2,4-dichlorophenol 6-monooxygenase [Pigmentiphaga humi]